MSTEDANPTLEEQAAAQDAAANASKEEGGAKKEKILGKFDSYEDLEKSYTELEKKLGSSKKDAAQEGEEETPKPKTKDKSEVKSEGNDAEENVEQKAREAVENAGVDFDALRASYDANGELTDEDYEALEKGGIPRHLVDEFIAGQEARRSVIEGQVFDAVGGKESYSRLTEWAADHLSEEEIEIYNAEVNSGNPARIMFAVNGLKAQFDRAEGFEPSRQITGKAGGLDGGSYQSWEQVRADMSDPRYERDPAYRAAVEAKVGRSKL